MTFAYPGATRNSVADVTFRADPGELVIITGESGAGKSTLSKLLTRFYDPSTGVICLDGVPLRDVPLEFLRENVALLPSRPSS